MTFFWARANLLNLPDAGSMEQPLQDREYLLLSNRRIVWRVRLFPLLPTSQERGTQSQQDFIDERNDVRDEEVQNEQHGGDGKQHREAQGEPPWVFLLQERNTDEVNK